MTRAAQDLRSSDTKVDTTRPCATGTTPPPRSTARSDASTASRPDEARRPESKLTLYPRLVFTLSVKGEEAMDYRIDRSRMPSAWWGSPLPTGRGTSKTRGPRRPSTGSSWVPASTGCWTLWTAANRRGWSGVPVLQGRRVRLLHGVRRHGPAVPRRDGGAHGGGGHLRGVRVRGGDAACDDRPVAPHPDRVAPLVGLPVGQ